MDLGKAAIRFADACKDAYGSIRIFTGNDPALRYHATIDQS
jgi:hypothetical protein